MRTLSISEYRILQSKLQSMEKKYEELLAEHTKMMDRLHNIIKKQSKEEMK